ncbi:MAG TPA: response regulator transcription factor [Trinickia sp.]|uniref:response regulator transcription factor n=1 Tax=Trinickia sp. TaxID=2571163 RepID=UPI002BBF1BAF|nr:response regulator transcription factor [Trinickia sp.]HVW50630.1 response regulator transcription factor [Trinickia sp.]
MMLAVMTQDAALFSLICQCLEAEGTQCSRFDNHVALARAVYREDYGAILVDAAAGIDPMLPVLARRACYADRRAPLIVVGASDDRNSIAQLVDAGADDVVLSPIDPRELALRVHIALRRFQPAQPGDADDCLEYGAYRLDRRSCTVFVEGEPIRLTTREFAIAWLLFSRPGEYASRRHIAGAVWSSSEDIVGRTLEQHIYKLRKKLDLSGQHGIHLRTMYAHGYRVEMSEVKDVEPVEPDISTVALAPSNVTPLAPRAEKTERAPHHAACAEIHPADSETARNAPSWPDPAAAAVRAACSAGTAKAMCLTWPEVSRSPYRRGS